MALRYLCKNSIPILLFAICSITLFSCHYTKHLRSDQFLLSHNKLKIQTQQPMKYKGEFESAVMSLISLQPNSHMFDLDMLPKYKLWKYNNRFAYYEKNQSDKKILKRKVEKPVLLDTAMVTHAVKNIKQYLINQGYYFSTIETRINQKNKEASVEYDIKTGKSYHISEVKFVADQPQIAAELQAIQSASYLKVGDVFTNFACGTERDRIYKYLRNKGYYDFKADNTVFIADSSDTKALQQLLDDPFESSVNFQQDTTEQDSMRVIVKIEQTKDATYYLQYAIDSVIVSIQSLPEYKLNPWIENEMDGIYFQYQHLPINRKVITRNIFVQPGDVFSVDNQEATINRLNQLNVFKNVNLKFEKSKSTTGKLICRIILALNDKHDFQALGDISTSDGDYLLGLGGSLTFRDRNLFHGGNQLLIRGTYALQTRRNDLSHKLFISGNNANISSTIIFPKFIVPFNQRIFNKRNVPSTLLGLNLSYIQRFENYTILNISGSFGYSWRETMQKNWTLTPSFLTLNYVPQELLSTEFNDKRKTNKYLANIFSSSVIYGENMTFQYRSVPHDIYGSFSSIKISAEEAGGLLTGINSIIQGVSTNGIRNVAKYIRVDIDYRKFKNYRKSQWANRVFIGVGMPYGNSTNLPYIKQYSSGGAFSIRGWQARNLGPGHSADTIYAVQNGVIDQTGDMKFEANTEYRFNLLKLFSGAINIKGATFIDVGNIWLFHEEKSLPGGNFQFRYFLNDLAIASGIGARLDFSFFVFRVDWGYPVKQPTLKSNYGFAWKQFSYQQGNWNIAINYPF